MNKLDIAKKVVDEKFDIAHGGIFNSRNVVGDTMTTIYNQDGLTIDICYGYAYFEVFGLTSEEFAELEKWYDAKVQKYFEELEISD